MNVQHLNVSQDDALAALREYKQHRDTYDQRDWEIERIYRAISKGKTVISVNNAIVRGGLDEQGRPRLAVCRAHARFCACETWTSGWITFAIADDQRRFQRMGRIKIPWPNHPIMQYGLVAEVPRIPPQHRPAANTLSSYHILWEADWKETPRDPYLLKRIGKDAWVVLAAWELTDVEISVLRAHQ